MRCFWPSLGTTAASAAQSAWVSDSGNVEIRIQGGTWLLNNAGPATIRPGTGAADFEVYYQDGNGTRCGYRRRIIENGAAIILEPTDSTQSSDLCPSGKFNRVEHSGPAHASTAAKILNDAEPGNQTANTTLNDQDGDEHETAQH